MTNLWIYRERSTLSEDDEEFPMTFPLQELKLTKALVTQKK